MRVMRKMETFASSEASLSHSMIGRCTAREHAGEGTRKATTCFVVLFAFGVCIVWRYILFPCVAIGSFCLQLAAAYIFVRCVVAHFVLFSQCHCPCIAFRTSCALYPSSSEPSNTLSTFLCYQIDIVR
jgi:hypothetical protein